MPVITAITNTLLTPNDFRNLQQHKQKVM